MDTGGNKKLSIHHLMSPPAKIKNDLRFNGVESSGL